MARQSLRGVLLSDFNADNCAALLNSSPEMPAVSVQAAPFGQVVQLLGDASASCWNPRPDFAVVWTRPEAVLPSFGALMEYRPVALDDLLQEVDAYAARLAVLQERARFALIPTWVLPTVQRGYGVLDMRTGLGLANTLQRLNLRLAEALDRSSNLYLLDARRWVESAGRQAFVPKLWYMGKIPFGLEVFKGAVRDVQAALLALSGGARKLLLLDLDDTLWGGIVGDLGWESVALGGHDPEGEAFVDFQQALKALTNRGILLGVVSKNTEAVALEAIASHPEMVLRQTDFAGWRINWGDKAQNIVDLAAELNLGLQSVVFIDDNPVERDRIRVTLPEVLVPDWPSDKTLYKQTLLSLTCFDVPSLNQEDRERAQMYATERERTATRLGTESLDDWLTSLELRVRVEPLDETRLPRAAQLLNKTNQMNLSTRRLSESELSEWARQPGNAFWTIRVADRFGDAGLTGLLGLSVEGNALRIVDYVLSCRVMGRKVEEAMAAVAVRFGRRQGVTEVVADYQPTAKNSPCLEFWRRSGFDSNGSDRFCWNASKEYPVPGVLTLEGELS
jgi:FkbH-like protein